MIYSKIKTFLAKYINKLKGERKRGFFFIVYLEEKKKKRKKRRREKANEKYIIKKVKNS